MPAAELAAAIQVTRRLALLHPDLAPLPTAGAPPPISPDLGQVRLRELGGEHAEERAARIRTDDAFDGGAIPIGAQEVEAADSPNPSPNPGQHQSPNANPGPNPDTGQVEAAEPLWRDLGLTCRPTAETLADMAAALVE